MNLKRDDEQGTTQLNIPQQHSSLEEHSEPIRVAKEGSESAEQALYPNAVSPTKQLQALQSITDIALTYLNLDDLLRETLARIREIMEVDNCAILLVAEDGEFLKVRVALGPEEKVAPEVRVPIGRGFAGYIAAHRTPLIVNDPSTMEIITPLLREELRSLMGVPLMIGERVIGVLHVGTRHPRKFLEEDVWLLQRVADRLALAIDHARLYEAEQRARTMMTLYAAELEATFESIADGVLVFDATGQVVRANAAAREMLGLDDQHQTYYSLPAPERIALFKLRDEHGQALEGEQWPLHRVLNGEVFKGEHTVDVMLQSLDGRELHLSVSGMPVYDNEGRIVRAVMIFRDVTARRDLERRTHEALNALLAMAEALVLTPATVGAGEPPLLSESVAEDLVAKRLAELTCDVLGCRRVSITTIEPETEKLRAAAVVGLTAAQEEQWWREQQQGASLKDSPNPELVARLRANEVLVLDLTEPPYHGRPNPYGIQNMLVAPMAIGEQLVGILSLDYAGIKHRYTQEEIALAGAVAKLIGLVIERERLLRSRAEAQANAIALREANRRMDEFLGIACHELKTPLAVIKGNVQLARRQLKRLPPDEHSHISTMLEQLLDNADHQADRLNRLVSDLLDVSRIQVGNLEMRMEPCDLASIVRNTVQEQRLVYPSRFLLLEIHTEKTVPIMADADRIGQVLTNYINNAMKYSSADKPVTVSLTVDGSLARVSVRDEGPGLSRAEQERIWERFQRVESIEVMSGSSVGLGLGLYISRMIIKEHHGTVGVESEPGQGSTFWFTLPLIEFATHA